jgi:hypothetical protein
MVTGGLRLPRFPASNVRDKGFQTSEIQVKLSLTATDYETIAKRIRRKLLSCLQPNK